MFNTIIDIMMITSTNLNVTRPDMFSSTYDKKRSPLIISATFVYVRLHYLLVFNIIRYLFSGMCSQLYINSIYFELMLHVILNTNTPLRL